MHHNPTHCRLADQQWIRSGARCDTRTEADLCRAFDADSGCDAMYSLSFLPLDGTSGIEGDSVQAVKPYATAVSERNDCAPTFNLASLFYDAVSDIPGDAVRAVQWYRGSIEKYGDLRFVIGRENVSGRPWKISMPLRSCTRQLSTR